MTFADKTACHKCGAPNPNPPVPGHPDDWLCPKGCGYVFAARTDCYACRAPNPNPPKAERPGDWLCPRGCGYVFASRTDCKLCRAPNPNPPKKAPAADVRPGDWMCPRGCGNVFAGKAECFQCGAPNPNPPADVRPGDWMCPKGCGNVFAGRTDCWNCRARKPESDLDPRDEIWRLYKRDVPNLDERKRTEKPLKEFFRNEGPKSEMWIEKKRDSVPSTVRQEYERINGKHADGRGRRDDDRDGRDDERSRRDDQRGRSSDDRGRRDDDRRGGRSGARESGEIEYERDGDRRERSDDWVRSNDGRVKTSDARESGELDYGKGDARSARANPPFPPYVNAHANASNPPPPQTMTMEAPLPNQQLANARSNPPPPTGWNDPTRVAAAPSQPPYRADRHSDDRNFNPPRGVVVNRGAVLPGGVVLGGAGGGAMGAGVGAVHAPYRPPPSHAYHLPPPAPPASARTTSVTPPVGPLFQPSEYDAYDTDVDLDPDTDPDDERERTSRNSMGAPRLSDDFNARRRQSAGAELSGRVSLPGPGTHNHTVPAVPKSKGSVLLAARAMGASAGNSTGHVSRVSGILSGIPGPRVAAKPMAPVGAAAAPRVKEPTDFEQRAKKLAEAKKRKFAEDAEAAESKAAGERAVAKRVRLDMKRDEARRQDLAEKKRSRLAREAAITVFDSDTEEDKKNDDDDEVVNVDEGVEAVDEGDMEVAEAEAADDAVDLEYDPGDDDDFVPARRKPSTKGRNSRPSKLTDGAAAARQSEDGRRGSGSAAAGKVPQHERLGDPVAALGSVPPPPASTKFAINVMPDLMGYFFFAKDVYVQQVRRENDLQNQDISIRRFEFRESVPKPVPFENTNQKGELALGSNPNTLRSWLAFARWTKRAWGNDSDHLVALAKHDKCQGKIFQAVFKKE